MQLTFLLVADLLAGHPVLSQTTAEFLWLGALGAVVTGVAIYGLLVRPTRKIVGLGPDSLAILFVYVGGIALLTAVPG